MFFFIYNFYEYRVITTVTHLYKYKRHFIAASTTGRGTPCLDLINGQTKSNNSLSRSSSFLLIPQ